MYVSIDSLKIALLQGNSKIVSPKVRRGSDFIQNVGQWHQLPLAVNPDRVISVTIREPRGIKQCLSYGARFEKNKTFTAAARQLDPQSNHQLNPDGGPLLFQYAKRDMPPRIDYSP
jgi:hypothetical protein